MPLVCTLQLFCYVNKLSSQKWHFIFYSCHIWSPLANVMSFKKRLHKSTWSFEYLLNALSFIETQRCRTMWDLSSSLGHWQDHRILHDPSDMLFYNYSERCPSHSGTLFHLFSVQMKGKKRNREPRGESKKISRGLPVIEEYKNCVQGRGSRRCEAPTFRKRNWVTKTRP